MSFDFENVYQIFQRSLVDIFTNINRCCIILKIIEQHKNDALAITDDALIMTLSMVRISEYVVNNSRLLGYINKS